MLMENANAQTDFPEKFVKLISTNVPTTHAKMEVHAWITLMNISASVVPDSPERIAKKISTNVLTILVLMAVHATI